MTLVIIIVLIRVFILIKKRKVIIEIFMMNIEIGFMMGRGKGHKNPQKAILIT